MNDIVEQARNRAISYRECGPSAEHTAAMLDELAFQVERLRAELAAAIKQRDEAAAWQPIETAPRGSGLDGPHRRDAVGYVDPPALLLACRDGVQVGSYDWYYHPGYGNGGSLGQSPWRDHYEGREISEVTHWMPLPQPPREKEGGGA